MTRISKFYMCLVALSVVYTLVTWNLKFGTPADPKSGFFPCVVSLLLLGTSLGLLVDSLKKGALLKHFGQFPPHDALWRVGAVLALLSAYTLCLESVGFIICTATLLVCLLRMLKAGSWFKIACICALLVGGAYLLFDQFLDVPLPMGILEDIV